MSRFLQLHYLTIYPLSNPNRDDLGRPKTANYGGVPRLRISSQALKRAVRLSDVVQADLHGHLGDRTQRIGEVVRDAVAGDCETEAQATEIATKVTDIFGKLDAEAAKRERFERGSWSSSRPTSAPRRSIWRARRWRERSCRRIRT